MMKIGICGAGGRMGREVCKAVLSEPAFELVCAVDPHYENQSLRELVFEAPEGLRIAARVEALVESGAEAMVDFSIAEAAKKNVPFALEHGIHCVVGTTGLSREDLESFEATALEHDVACLVAPNFAIGAVLMMHFASQAGRYLEGCEIVEMHHQAKIDAPSGTSRHTARMILEARGVDSWEEKDQGPRGLSMGGINLHSVRLPGLVAHQEVIFGGKGQTLIIRHDSFDRSSFMPGVILSLKKIAQHRGLVVGLQHILEL